MKLYKGYVVTAIDGSDFELPNTKANREVYTTAVKESCARATVSAMVDVLNGYIIDTQIKPYRSSELEMEKEHLKHAKELIIDTPIIRLKDKNYRSVEDFFYSNKSNEKFVTRLKSSNYKEYIENRQTQDEEIEIKYQYDRVRYYRKRNPELYEELMKHKSIKIRMVKFKLETGEEEILATNLGMEFTYTDIAELYKLRWKIEQTYHTLKESLKIETISSSKKPIIEQEILSQMLVYNIVQSFENEVNEKTESQKKKYKYKMRVNKNMAIGLLKEDMIYIVLEEDKKRKDKMVEELEYKILKYLVPVRENRKYPRNKISKNKHHINKRKTF